MVKETNMPLFRHSRHSGYPIGLNGDVRFHPAYARLPDGRIVGVACSEAMQPIAQNFQQTRYLAYMSVWREWVVANPELLEELRVKATQHGLTLQDDDATGTITHGRALAQLLTEQANTI